jgi:hypothetical protein
MKTRVTVAIIIALAMIACDKDKFETKPSLEFRSKNTDVVPVNGSLRVTLEFTDKEGDVHDSIWVKKQRLNQKVTATLRDSLVYGIPDYPGKTRGEFEITLDYQSILSAVNPPNIPGSVPPRKESDTLNLKFAVRDKAGNTSDTLSIGTIVVQRSL